MRASSILHRAGTALFRREPWWAEAWSALTALAWSAMSWGSMENVAVWPSMQVLLRLGDDRTWHLLAGSLGLAQLAFLAMDRRWLRWAGAVAGCWFWAVLTVGIWVAVPGAPSAAVYAGWCGINAFSILRLLRRHE